MISSVSRLRKLLHLDPWGVALLEGASFQSRLHSSHHPHPGLRPGAFRKHVRHEFGQHPANNGTMEDPRTVQGVSEGKLDLTFSINLREDYTSAQTSGSPHGEGPLSPADAITNPSLVALALEIPALRCLFAVGLLVFCFFFAGGGASTA